MNDSRSFRLYHVQVFLVAFLTVILILQISIGWNLQFDFTEEKRYTIHPQVKSLLRSLEDPVTIEVYLAGELPANFKRLHNGTRQTLEGFSEEAGKNIQFRFVDPAIAASTSARNEFYRQLIERGLQPSNVSYTKDGQKTDKLVFPGAIFSYRGRELGINFLKGNRARSIEEMLNQSIEGLEYEIANGVRQITNISRKKIGFITGHHHLDSTELAGFTNALLQRFDLFKIDLPNRTQPLKGYDAIIIGKPSSRFSEIEKFWLDQYVMDGGNLVVFIDALGVDMREAAGEGTIAIPYDLNLEDMLFKYGVRINNDYVADVNCGNTPVVTGQVGDQPRIELLPWPYWPIITNYGTHPVMKGLDATWFRGSSTIDTVKAKGISKTPLFFTSDFTKVFGPPVRISYNDLNQKLDPETFKSGQKVLGYLLEGKFASLYANRFKPSSVRYVDARESGLPAKIVIVSDGDFIRNDFSIEDQKPLPMGMDPYSKTNYANVDFLNNVIDYMVDDIGLFTSRNREIQIRPLDKVRIKQAGNKWRWINVALPILLIFAFGVLKGSVRKYRYGRK